MMKNTEIKQVGVDGICTYIDFFDETKELIRTNYFRNNDLETVVFYSDNKIVKINKFMLGDLDKQGYFDDGRLLLVKMLNDGHLMSFNYSECKWIFNDFMDENISEIVYEI